MDLITKLLRAGAPIMIPLILIAFIVVSAVLNYHWTRYGVEGEGIKKVRRWYFGVSAFWIVIIIFSFVSVLWSAF